MEIVKVEGIEHTTSALVEEIDDDEYNSTVIVQCSPLISMGKRIVELIEWTRNIQNQQDEKHPELYGEKSRVGWDQSKDSSSSS